MATRIRFIAGNGMDFLTKPVNDLFIPDLGMLASTDILAVDQASIDMVYCFGDSRKDDLIERIESREGLRQLSSMEELKMGSREYELVSVD